MCLVHAKSCGLNHASYNHLNVQKQRTNNKKSKPQNLTKQKTNAPKLPPTPFHCRYFVLFTSIFRFS